MNVRFMAHSELAQSGWNVRRGVGPSPFTLSRMNDTDRANHANRPGNAASNGNNAVTTAGQNILEALSGMGHGNRSSVFNNLQGHTSESDVATVAVNNSRLISSMPPRDTTIDVVQAAQAQVNEGTALAANGRAVGSGSFTFTIAAGGTNHTFNINVVDGDTNATIQQRMADAINMRNTLGVEATVVRERIDGVNTTRLDLTAAQTGTNSAFTVSDTVGNLAQGMGITSATQEAQNAIFSIDGGITRHSQSNEVSLGAGVTATLRGAGRTEITFGHNTEDSVRAVTNLVNALNTALRSVNPNDGRGSERFIRDIQGMNATFASSLARVGIDVSETGRLTINESRLRSAAEDGSLTRLFDNQHSGFGARVERIASNAANTNHYRNNPVTTNLISPNTGFNFGNTQNSWSMMNIFG